MKDPNFTVLHLSDVVGVDGVRQAGVAARLHHRAHGVRLAHLVLLQLLIQKLTLGPKSFLTFIILFPLLARRIDTEIIPRTTERQTS